MTARSYPAAVAAVYPPAARRRLYCVLYCCPVCGGHHVGRARTPDVDGVRRSGCGRLIHLTGDQR